MVKLTTCAPNVHSYRYSIGIIFAESAKSVALSNIAWNFAVTDQYAAYKCEPRKPGPRRFCALSDWGPSSWRYVDFTPLTPIFGSVASVLNYNSQSRIIANLSVRISQILVSAYFSDFDLSPLLALVS